MGHCRRGLAVRPGPAGPSPGLRGAAACQLSPRPTPARRHLLCSAPGLSSSSQSSAQGRESLAEMGARSFPHPLPLPHTTEPAPDLEDTRHQFLHDPLPCQGLRKGTGRLGKVVHACDPRAWNAELGGLLGVQGLPGLYSKTLSQTNIKQGLARAHPGKVLAVQTWPPEFNP